MIVMTPPDGIIPKWRPWIRLHFYLQKFNWCWFTFLQRVFRWHWFGRWRYWIWGFYTKNIRGCPVGPCRVPDRWIEYPVPFCRFYYPNRKFYSNKLWRDKQGRQEDLPLETAKHFVRYALPTKLSRCNDHGPSPSASKSSSTLSGLATFVLICLFSGTRPLRESGTRFQKYP